MEGCSGRTEGAGGGGYHPPWRGYGSSVVRLKSVLLTEAAD